jgi:hypothetical protein
VNRHQAGSRKPLTRTNAKLPVMLPVRGATRRNSAVENPILPTTARTRLCIADTWFRNLMKSNVLSSRSFEQARLSYVWNIPSMVFLTGRSENVEVFIKGFIRQASIMFHITSDFGFFAPALLSPGDESQPAESRPPLPGPPYPECA